MALIFQGNRIRPAVHCPAHPDAEVSFRGDRCYRCKTVDKFFRPKRFPVWPWLLAVAAVALLAMAASSALATWMQINGPF